MVQMLKKLCIPMDFCDHDSINGSLLLGGLPQEDTSKMHYLDLRMRLEDKESLNKKTAVSLGAASQTLTCWISPQ